MPGRSAIVAVSMGSFIAQELMLARPDLVSAAVLMATRGREDRTRDFFRAAEFEFLASGIELPPKYDAKVRLLESFSPKTLNDDTGRARLDRDVHHVADEADAGDARQIESRRRATGCPLTGTSRRRRW